jgi:hypothetical protein
MSRRTLLGAALVTVAGCTGHSAARSRPTSSATTPAAAPDADALADARNQEQLLLASYDAAIAHAKRSARPQLEVQRALHATHLSALGVGTSGATDIAVVSGLRRALRRSTRRLREQSLAATSGRDAALLASIAASHEASAL